MLVTMKALRSYNVYDSSIRTRGTDEGMQQGNYASNKDANIEDDIKFELSGNYSIRITAEVMDKARRGEDILPKWKSNLNGVKNNNYKYRLHPRLVDAIINRVNNSVDVTILNDFYDIEGYTRLTTISQDGNQVIYHANSHIQGRCGTIGLMYTSTKRHHMERPLKGFILRKFLDLLNLKK
jgi:hypothetical protein